MEKRIQRNRINRVVVTVCGVLLGIVLIAFGVYRNINSEYSKLKLPTSEKTQSDVNVLYQEIEKMRKEMVDEYNKNGNSEKYEDLNRKIQEKEMVRANLEERLLKINNHEFDNLKRETVGKSMPFFICGIIVILASLMISGVLSSIQNVQRKK